MSVIPSSTSSIRRVEAAFFALDLGCGRYREVVIKTGIKRGGQLASGIDGWQLLAREAWFYKRIQGTPLRTHAPELIEYTEDGDTNFLVLEILRGGTLRDLIARDRLSVSDVQAAFDVLGRFHSCGFVLGDAKIDNVQWNDGTAYFFDFECARLSGEPVAVNMDTYRFRTADQLSSEVNDRISFLLSILISGTDRLGFDAAPLDLDDFVVEYAPETELQAWSHAKLESVLSAVRRGM